MGGACGTGEGGGVNPGAASSASIGAISPYARGSGSSVRAALARRGDLKMVRAGLGELSVQRFQRYSGDFLRGPQTVTLQRLCNQPCFVYGKVVTATTAQFLADDTRAALEVPVARAGQV